MSFFWEDALDSDVAAEGYCLLTLLVDPSDRAAYRAWLGIGSSDGNSAGYRRIRAYAEAHDLEPREVCEKLANGEVQIPYSARVLQRHELLKTRLLALAGVEGQALIDALWSAQEIEARTVRTAAQTIALTEPAPKDLLQTLREVITQPELPDSSSDVIRIMSLHKSKGLTAELVVIAGCVAGAIPTLDKKQPAVDQDASLKEQRRLFYVAITRAKDTLILSSVVRLPLATALQANIPPVGIFNQLGIAYARLAASPFLAELGQAAPRAVRGTDWRAALGI
jgi:superfamily I DNA/RNA helicase